MKRGELDWKRAYGSIPDDYSRNFEKTLSELKEEQFMNKKIALRGAAVAAIICLLLVGTALALGSALGILDFFSGEYGLTPRDDARMSITKALGSSVNDRVRLTVREAVYDGDTVRALLALEPLEPDKYILTDEIGDIISVEDSEIAEERAEEYRKATGKTILVAADVGIDVDDVGNYTGSGCISRDGDTLLAYWEISFNGEVPASVTVVARAEILDGDECSVVFELEKTPASVRELTPDKSADGEFSILSASLSRTPFADYLRVIYQAPETSYYEIAQTIDADETYYMTEYGNFAHLDPQCSGMANAAATPGKDVIAKGKSPCPICAGGDAKLWAGPEAWEMKVMDEEGRLISVAGHSGGEVSLPGHPGAYGALLILQSGELPRGVIYIQPTYPDGADHKPIALRDLNEG